MNSTQVKCLIEAARSRSFAEAAERLYMTPSTLGRHISALEAELGFPLFDRGHKQSVLTPPGEVIYEGFLELGARFQTICQTAEHMREGSVGMLSLGILAGQMIDEPLNRILDYFRENYPQLQLRLERYSFREMETCLLAGDLDVGITLTQELEHTPSLNYQPFQSIENRLVLPAGHPLAKKASLTLSELADTPLLGLEFGECRNMHQQMVACCVRAGFQPRCLLFPDLSTQILALEAGLGMMPLNINHIACYNPRLVTCQVEGLPAAEFCFAWNKGNQNSSIPLFLEHCKM